MSLEDRAADLYTQRRRVPRRAFKNQIGLLVSGLYQVETGLEIGEGGMMFQSPRSLEVGKMLAVTFKLPGVSPCVVRAVVKYVLPHLEEGNPQSRYGVEFLELDFNYKREIRNYVASKSEHEANAMKINSL